MCMHMPIHLHIIYVCWQWTNQTNIYIVAVVRECIKYFPTLPLGQNTSYNKTALGCILPWCDWVPYLKPWYTMVHSLTPLQFTLCWTHCITLPHRITLHHDTPNPIASAGQLIYTTLHQFRIHCITLQGITCLTLNHMALLQCIALHSN